MGRIAAAGIQDFSEIREKNLFYVDKTSFIKEWWESNDKVTLITRPRRFGKTLTMSMVEQFFSVEYAERNDLFDGLDIWKEEKYRELQGTYPVVSLSFASVKEDSFLKTKKKICHIIERLYSRYDFLLEGELLNTRQKNFFENVSPDMEDYVSTSSLGVLSEYLYKYYGKKAVILLDEYDTPMQEAYVNGFWDELVGFMRGLLGSAFKTNPFLERGIMTGITRVSKESIFSDLNNLVVVTTTSNKYADSFGFTEKEVFDTLEEFGLEEQRDGVKEWYDGFRFGDCDNIYNPWSVIGFIREKEFKAYWVNTSSNKLVGKLIREGSSDVKLAMEDLLQGRDISTQIDEEIVFDQIDGSSEAVWSFLLAGGYLKVAGREVDNSSFNIMGSMYRLALTNLEVVYLFQKLIHDWFANKDCEYNGFVNALLASDLESMNGYMNKVTSAVISNFDSGTKPSDEIPPEKFYHGFVLGIMLSLGDKYVMTSNRESGFGRYDVLLEPRSSRDDGIIFEFKVFNPKKDSSLDITAQKALQQIIDKKYAAGLESKGVSSDKIRIYGFAFRGKEVLIDGGYLSEFASRLEPAGSTAGKISAGKLTAF